MVDAPVLPYGPPKDALKFNAQDMLLNVLNRDPEHPVVIFDDTGYKVTAREYQAIVSKYVQALISEGIDDNIRFGVLSKNRPEVLFLSGALGFVDVCRVSMHPMGSVSDFEYIINDSHIEALIIDADHYQEIARELQQRIPHLKKILTLGPTKIGTDLGMLAETFKAKALKPSYSAKNPEAISAISYSGGTTGEPKAICQTGRSGGTCFNIMMSEWEWPEINRHLVCAPLSHGGGAMVTPTLLKGGTLIVLPGFDAGRVLASIEKHKITTLWLVPAMIYALLDHPDFDRYDLSSIDVIYYGGSSISPTRLKEAIERIGPVFFQFYGQAEAPMTVSIMRRSEHHPNDLNRLASCGRPSMGVRVALLDDDLNEVSDGESGEICVQGPLLMGGYLNKPEETAKAFEGGWLHTGDVAVKDPDGFMRIVDRKKEMIVTGGFNVFPREIEDVLTTHPSVASAAVFGLPHEKWGEMVKAVVVLRNDKTVTEAELINLVKDKKGRHQAPKSISFIDEIPLSAVGKPDKKILRLQFSEE